MAFPQFRYYSLRAKLMIAFLTVALIPLGLLWFLNARAARQVLINDANERLLGAATQAAISIDSFIRANLDAIRTEAQLPTFVDYLSRSATERHNSASESRVTGILHALSRKDPLNISSYALLDVQGRNVMDTFTADIGVDKSDRNYFQVPLRTGLPYASPIQFSPLAPGRASLHFSSPIRDQTGATVGLLTTRYNAAVLQQLIIQTNGLAGKQSFAILLDDNHIRLAHGTAPDLLFKSVVPLGPDRIADLHAMGRWPGDTTTSLSTNLPTFEQGLATVENDEPYFITRLNATGDVLNSAAVTRLETQPWLVAFAQPQDVFLAPIDAQTSSTLLLAVLIAGVVGGAAVLIAHTFAVPIMRLTQAAESVAAGDLTVQADVAPHDEVGQLATAFNSMTLQLQQLIQGLNQRIAEREQAEEALQQAHDALESRVAERTVALQCANAQLQTEIADHKRTAAALQASEVQFRNLLDTAPDAVVIVNRDGLIVLVNAQAEALFGYTRQEMLGKPVELLVPEFWRDADVRHRPAYVRELYRRSMGVGVVITGRRQDGSRFPAEISLSPLETEAELLITSIIRDLTERRRLEEQLRQSQKMEAVGTLAGGIAHEFNNALSAIIGYADLTQQDLEPRSRAWSNVQAVLQAGYRSKDLVQQILTFSRPSESKAEPIDIAWVIQDALKLLRPTLPTTIEIRQQIEPNLGRVLANVGQLQQVLMNLCGNAEYAMRQMGGVLEISADVVEVDAAIAALHPALQPGPHVRVTVSDTGGGMPPEVVERVFEPFYTTKGVGEGTGMGLAIVHGIVMSHGGAITVESTLNQGTVFNLYLPATTHEPEALVERPELTLPQGAGRLILVDDEEALALLGKQQLERQGYEVEAYTSSVRALDAVRAEPERFDLVITDQTMPEMTGVTLATELRHLRPDLPIILCTGFSHVVNAESAAALGVDAFVMKPIVLHELLDTIQRVLGPHGDLE